MKMRLIEWDLPLAEISGASAHEKNIHVGLPPQFHVWWARKPLASSRVIALASLLDVPSQNQAKKRNELLQLLEQITPLEAVKNGDMNFIKEAKRLVIQQYNGHPPKVLDPFAGGGSIPLETSRLGCETYANDYNPVAVFIEKATLEWPQKFGIDIPHPDKNPGIDGGIEKINLLAYLVEKWAKKNLEIVKKEIAQFYPEASSEGLLGKSEISEQEGWIPVSYLWARTIPCQNPSCGTEIPLVSQQWLAKRTKKKIAYRMITDKKNKKIDFEILTGEKLHSEMENGFNPNDGTVSRGNTKCPICGQVVKGKQVRRLAKNGKMGQRMIAVVFHHPNETGKRYRLATEEDIEVYNKAVKYLDDKIKDWTWIECPIPNERIANNPRSLWCTLYGLTKFGDLFNSRQQLTLIAFVEAIRSSYDTILEEVSTILKHNPSLDYIPEELTKAVMGYLAIILDRQADFGSSLCIWDVGGEISKHTFGRQALPITWNYSEVNTFSDSTGSYVSQLYYILTSLNNFIIHPPKISHVECVDATNLPYVDNFFDAIFTDPPYYDNVPYADLSDFFYVWLKRAIGDYFPELFSTPVVPKNDEAIMEPMRHKTKEDAKAFFEEIISQSFQEIFRVLKPQGIATIVYAHKTTEGWETMLNSLVNAGFVVTASWPIHTEMESRLRATASAVLASSIYMVCRKSKRKEVGFYSEIKTQIKNRIEQKLQQFWNEGIAGGDFFISAIGPGMEIFSQYERVEKLSGEQVKTAELLDYIRSVSTDFIVNKLLHDVSSGNIDNSSEFYLAYRWTYMDNTVEYDDARKLASASGFSLEDHWGPDGFVKKRGSNISILGPKERGKIKHVDNMVDVMHRCLLLWERGDREEITRLLAETGFKDDPAFKQFCQAVAESLLNGNKEKQLLEGFLIGIDSYAKAKVKMHRDQTGLDQFGGR